MQNYILLFKLLIFLIHQKQVIKKLFTGNNIC